MKLKDSLVTQLTLANGAAVVAAVADDILNSSDDVNNTVGGSPVSTELLYQLAQSSFQITLNNTVLKGQ